MISSKTVRGGTTSQNRQVMGSLSFAYSDTARETQPIKRLTQLDYHDLYVVLQMTF